MRLIDADLLKDHIGSYAGMVTYYGFMVNLDAVLSGIDFQPTAYDIDWVMKELEEKSKYEVVENKFEQAIEIVKKGGAV